MSLLQIASPIETERVRVRHVAEPDLPALLAVNADEAVTRFLPYATWRSMDDAKAWYERMARIEATGSALQLVVADRQSDTPIGTCLLFQYDAKSARAELGFVLGRDAWGRGYMTEALVALIGSAFTTMGLRRLEAQVDPHNHSSRRLLQRLGFVREGLLRQRWIDKGAPADCEFHGLLCAEWRSARG